MHIIIIQTITGGIASIGYSLLYNIKKNRILISFVTSTIICAIYLLMDRFVGSLFFDNMICAALATTFAEILARLMHAPAIVFLTPPLFPLVPGGYLYYTMYAIVTRDRAMALSNASSTAVTALGIAIGIVIVSVIMSFGKKKAKTG